MAMKTRTVGLAAMLALAACTEGGPDVAGAPDVAPGDPAVYAPEGWPLKIGDRMSLREHSRFLLTRHRLPLPPPGESAAGFMGPHPITSPWGSYVSGMHLVEGRVYAPLFQGDPKVGEYPMVYLGHFRRRFNEGLRRTESDLPPEYHGRIEYYPLPPPAPRIIGEPLPIVVIPPGTWSADGRQLKPDPDFLPHPIDALMWPDYAGRRN